MIRRRFFTVTLVLAGLCEMMLSGCAHRRATIGPAVAELSPLQQLPSPTGIDLASASRPYLIGPFDRLTIDVFGVPDLSREVQADASGRIAMPLIGVIEASGKTPAMLADLIRDRLSSNFVRDPQVSVNLKESLGQLVTVDGQVREPGMYPVVGRMTLMRAIATAKGTAEFAKLEDVIVFRTVNGQKMAAVYDLRAIRLGRYDDPEVFANDVISVGDDPGQRIFRAFLQSVPAFLTPLVYLLR